MLLVAWAWRYAFPTHASAWLEQSEPESHLGTLIEREPEPSAGENQAADGGARRGDNRIRDGPAGCPSAVVPGMHGEGVLAQRGCVQRRAASDWARAGAERC